MDYSARIRIHNGCYAGTLVEVAGEFDVACLDAFGHALESAADSVKPVFVDLSGITFMDTLCVRRLVDEAESGRVRLCEPSAEVLLSAAACDLEEKIEICPADDPGYEAVIRHACRCRRPDLGARQRKHRLYLRAGAKTASGWRGVLFGPYH